LFQQKPIQTLTTSVLSGWQEGSPNPSFLPAYVPPSGQKYGVLPKGEAVDAVLELEAHQRAQGATPRSYDGITRPMLGNYGWGKRILYRHFVPL
jgi:hypothetical protein